MGQRLVLAFLADKYEWLSPSTKALSRGGKVLTKAEAAAVLKTEAIGKNASAEEIKKKLEEAGAKVEVK